MQDLQREGNIQGEEVGKGKLHGIRGDSGGVILEGAHGQASWNKYTT